MKEGLEEWKLDNLLGKLKPYVLLQWNIPHMCICNMSNVSHQSLVHNDKVTKLLFFLYLNFRQNIC